MRYKGFATFLFVLLMMFSVAAVTYGAETKFPDVPKNHWAYESITALNADDVISGYPDGTFRPDANVTRAEWAKMLSLTSGLEADADRKIQVVDVSDDDWYAEYVYAIIDYMPVLWDVNGNITFVPEEDAIREGVTVSLVGVMDYIVEVADPDSLSKFSDADEVTSHYENYIATAVEKGLIKGFEDNTFRPQTTLTRAEAATLLHRAFYDDSVSVLMAASPETVVDVEIVIKDYYEKQGMFDVRALEHIEKDTFLYNLVKQTVNYEDTLYMIAQGSGMSGELQKKYVTTMLEIEKNINKHADIKVLETKKDGNYVKVAVEKSYLNIADKVANTDYRRFLTDEEYNEMLLNSAIMSEEEYLVYTLELYIKVMPRMYDALIADATETISSAGYVLKNSDGKWLIVAEY